MAGALSTATPRAAVAVEDEEADEFARGATAAVVEMVASWSSKEREKDWSTLLHLILAGRAIGFLFFLFFLLFLLFFVSSGAPATRHPCLPLWLSFPNGTAERSSV